MSFSNPKAKNPATKFIEFKGESGNFQYYDKEKEDNVIIPIPIYFVVLDELHTVRGYNKNHKAGVFSNEVRNIKEELLSVRVFNSDIKIVGLWDQIKGEVTRIQGHYSKSVYAGLITKGNPMELVNFQFHGASRAPWFDCKIDKEQFGITVKEVETDDSGSIKFKRPVFSKLNLRDDIIKEAKELDRKLQEYLKTYLRQKEEEIVEAGIDEPPENDVIYTDVEVEEQNTYSDEEIYTKMHEPKKKDIPNQNDYNDLPF